MTDVRHISISIARPPSVVYAFASDPTNLPRWASGLARSEVRKDGDAWVADAPFGRVRMRFAPPNSFGVIDHDVQLESGVTVHNAMRVIPNGDGSELVFTLIRQPGMSDAELARDGAVVESDLRTLKDLLERPNPQLYVERSIEIAASPARVWRVLTSPELTATWSGDFGASGPIESAWDLASPVHWRNAEGRVYVDGHVTAVEPEKLLRFTVRDVSGRLRPISGRPEDEITQTFVLSREGGRTVLSTSHGDFGGLPNGDELYPLVGQLWDQLLPRIKAIAETGPGAV